MSKTILVEMICIEWGFNRPKSHFTSAKSPLQFIYDLYNLLTIVTIYLQLQKSWHGFCLYQLYFNSLTTSKQRNYNVLTIAQLTNYCILTVAQLANSAIAYFNSCATIVINIITIMCSRGGFWRGAGATPALIAAFWGGAGRVLYASKIDG